jgi:hypothetical protein|nr:hypothetical protein [uncultured Flavobacterium sp.]
MEYWPKHICHFFLASLLSNVIFILYLKATDYSGGEIGMAPFLTLLNATITFVISITVLVLLKFLKIYLSTYMALVMFSLVSTLTLFIYFKIDPFEGYLSDVELWTMISVFIGCLIIGLTSLIKKNFA